MKVTRRPSFKLVHGLLFAMATLAPLPAVAQTQTPAQAQSPDAELDQKLAKYDPVAVKAAQHYAQVFNMKTVLAQSMPAVREAVIKMVKQKNPTLDDSTVTEFVEAALKVMYVDQAPFYE